MAGYKEITEFSIDGRDTLSFFTNQFGNFYIEFTLTEIGSPAQPIGLRLYVLSKATKDTMAVGLWGIYRNKDKSKDEIEIEFNNFYSQAFKFIQLQEDAVHLEVYSKSFTASDGLSDDFAQQVNITMRLREYNF